MINIHLSQLFQQACLYIETKEKEVNLLNGLQVVVVQELEEETNRSQVGNKMFFKVCRIQKLNKRSRNETNSAFLTVSHSGALFICSAFSFSYSKSRSYSLDRHYLTRK